MDEEEVSYEVCDHCAKSVEECDEEEECVGSLIREREVIAERLGHIQQWSAFFLEATESWSGVLGQELAYLFAAMADGSRIDVSPDHPFLPILKEHGVPPDDSIYLYLNVVENVGELEADESIGLTMGTNYWQAPTDPEKQKEIQELREEICGRKGGET